MSRLGALPGRPPLGTEAAELMDSNEREGRKKSERREIRDECRGQKVRTPYLGVLKFFFPVAS